MKTMRKVVSTLLLVCVLATLLCVSASADSMIKFTTPSQGSVTIDENKDYTLTVNAINVDQFQYCWYWKINGQYVDGNGNTVSDPMGYTNLSSITINKPAGSYTVTVEVVSMLNSAVVDSCTTVVIAQAAALVPEHIAFTTNYVKLDSYGDWGPNVATVYPEGCNQSVTWSSDNSSVAWVDSATGLVHAVGSGTTTIWATSTSNSNVKASFVVEVEIPATSITLDKSYLDLDIGDSETITATVRYGATSEFLTWRSSNNAVATVNNSGLVTAVGEGTATITASTTDGSAVSNQCLVTVRANTAVTVTVTPVNVDLVLGQSATLTATITVPAGKTGTYIDHWYSNSPAVSLQASNNTCVIKGIQTTGNTPIEVRAYAHDGGVYGYALVTVSQADSLQLDVSSYSINSGKTTTLTPANAVNGETFSWTYTPNDGSIISNALNKGNSLVLTAGESDGTVTVTCTSKMDSSRVATATIGVNGVEPYGNATILPKSATWTRTDGDLTFQISPAAYYMYLDNQFLNNKSTSQIVYWNGALTLKAAYLATLSNGTHTLKIYTAYDSNNNPTGLVYANIYINGNSATGSASATYGDNAHVKGTASNLYFNAANPISDVYISGKWIDPANYSLSTDAKTLTLNANFLNQLAYGSYTMTLNNNSGTTQTTSFRIVTANYAPSTGDEANAALWIAIMILSGAGMVALLPRRKKSVQ